MAEKTSYPYLAQIQDNSIRMALQLLYEQVSSLQQGSQAQRGALNMGRNRVRNLAPPEDADDAVTLSHLQDTVAALEEKIKNRGASGLTGQLAEPQVPRIIDIDPAEDLPDKTIAQPYMMVRQGAGSLFFFNPKTSEWEAV